MHSKDKRHRFALELRDSLFPRRGGAGWAEPAPHHNSSAPLQGPQRKPAGHFAQYAGSRGTGNARVLLGACSWLSPPISISPLPILQIKSACRNNCVQHGDRLLPPLSISGLALTQKQKETRAHNEVRDGGREGRTEGGTDGDLETSLFLLGIILVSAHSFLIT